MLVRRRCLWLLWRLRIWLWNGRCRRDLRWVSGVVYRWSRNLRWWLLYLLNRWSLRNWGRRRRCLHKRGQDLWVDQLEEQQRLENGVSQLRRLSQELCRLCRIRHYEALHL